MPRVSWFAALSAAASLLAVSARAASPAADVPRFRQDRFVIGSWVPPRVDGDLDARLAEMAAARFNLMVGLCGGKAPPPASEQLAAAERHGIRVLVGDDGSPPERLPDGPACWGYLLGDEPATAAFPAIRARVDALRAARPGRLAYVNLFPDYAKDTQLGATNYESYVGRFVDGVRPDVLSMDHYPAFRPGSDGRAGYLRNLEAMRRASLAAGIPHWNYFNAMPFGPHTDPTEAQLRWQASMSVAHGSKGVLYFCYWTPRGDEFPRGGAILAADGRRTRHYDEATRLNAVLANLGPTLMRLTSTGVERISSARGKPVRLAGALRSLEDGEFVAGTFRHADGRVAVYLANHEFAYSAWPTVAFAADAARVAEVDPRTGREVPVRDDSPDMPGLQLSFDAGEGRLFLLPAE